MYRNKCKSITILDQEMLCKFKKAFPRVDVKDREDAMQYAWYRMFQNELFGSLDTPEMVLNWLWTVSKNYLLNILRDRRDLPIPENFDASCNDYGIEVYEAEQEISAFLNTLSLAERQLFAALVEGMSVTDAADVLGKKSFTIYKQRERAAVKYKRFCEMQG
jgi:DNA-directed RNA polymerase specialized sigma24 family protein